MKYLLSILCLFIFSCDSDTEPSYECNGYIDEICGECSVNLWDTCFNIEETTHLFSWDYNISSEIPPEIGNLTNLTHLFLTDNQITEIPPEIGELINLEILNLNDNQLISLPESIGNLTNLNYLYLQNNQFVEIPPEIGNMTNLTHLMLYNNQLSGDIPSWIGNLTNIRSLELNNNQLTGEIPSEICNITLNPEYGWIILENNQLCPPYPECLIIDYILPQDTSNCP